jgi:hypothetical protein
MRNLAFAVDTQLSIDASTQARSWQGFGCFESMGG